SRQSLSGLLARTVPCARFISTVVRVPNLLVWCSGPVLPLRLCILRANENELVGPGVGRHVQGLRRHILRSRDCLRGGAGSGTATQVRDDIEIRAEGPGIVSRTGAPIVLWDRIRPPLAGVAGMERGYAAGGVRGELFVPVYAEHAVRT